MDLKVLQREAHAIAKEHGWWDQERTFGDLIALVHSELSEALEWYREGEHVQPMREESPQYGLDDPLHGKYKPVGVPSELADVVIRVADMAEHYEENLESYVSFYEGKGRQLAYERFASTFGEWVAMLHMQLSDACAAWYVHKDRCLWVNALAQTVALVYHMAAHYGIDLDAAIEAKMEYNRTRPYRHGGKAL